MCTIPLAGVFGGRQGSWRGDFQHGAPGRTTPGGERRRGATAGAVETGDDPEDPRVLMDEVGALTELLEERLREIRCPPPPPPTSARPFGPPPGSSGTLAGAPRGGGRRCGDGYVTHPGTNENLETRVPFPANPDHDATSSARREASSLEWRQRRRVSRPTPADHFQEAIESVDARLGFEGLVRALGVPEAFARGGDDTGSGGRCSGYPPAEAFPWGDEPLSSPGTREPGSARGSDRAGAGTEAVGDRDRSSVWVTPEQLEGARRAHRESFVALLSEYAEVIPFELRGKPW